MRYRPADLLLTHVVRWGAALLPDVLTRTPGGALTFDDGPYPAVTPALVEALGATRAAFFLLADRATSHPELVRSLAAAGHHVALHGPSHVDLWRSRFDTTAWDAAQARLEALLGAPVRYVRPPNGHITPALLRWARQRGVTVVLWDVMPGDFLPHASPDTVVEAVRRLGRPDSIVVLHESASLAPVVVPTVQRLVAGQAWGTLP